ncbi:MAG: hypothetical protein JNK15_02980 [Planctomycetes bacterium]|nr:hypothetical protein [Planctomycetota bacterium]
MRALVLVLLLGSVVAQQRVPLDGTWQVRPEADANGWRDVAVPAAFETALGIEFDGVAIYRRTLPAGKPTAHTRLEFAAVATHATVTVNGTKLGEHLGGWTPFRVDVSAAMKHDGSDVLEVRVDEKVGHNTQGFLPIVQPHFGGIWQGVTLCRDDGPVFDRLAVFAWGEAEGSVRCEVPVLGGDGRSLQVAIQIDDEQRLAATWPVASGSAQGTAKVQSPSPWSPTTPNRHHASFRLLDGARELDRLDTRFAFRQLVADGTRVLWNDSPLQVRGLLHWGYSPPHLAPPTDPGYWREQLTRARQRGFNTVKCCLWVPPKCVYDLADELGILLWQEYPTWHPQMDQAHKQELLAEYAEFFRHDRSHPSVAFRSITCETGHGADLDVVRALYDACKAAVPDTLVVDDSSWIGWQRVTDFWDEHPYGNNSWFPGRLDEFARHIAEKGEKPLLLGECIAADTWVDSTAWRAAHGDTAPWWRPDCWTAQQPAEAWLVQRFGADTLASLRPESLAFAMRNRKFQIERLRLQLPAAGYVVSVARDFAKARMGLDDDVGQPKWTPAEWAWHGDTMLCLDATWDQRSVPGGGRLPRVRVAHSGVGDLDGEVELWLDDATTAVRQRVHVAAGAVSEPLPDTPATPTSGQLQRVRLHAKLTGTHTASNAWDLWLVPQWSYRGGGPQVVDRLTPELLDRIEAGERVLLCAGDRPGSPRTEALWSLRGAPFAPPHPVHASVPAAMLLDLCSFDLETGRVLPLAAWHDELDPFLAFWETHDIPEVRFHALAAETRLGKGRLMVTTLRLEGRLHSLGFHVQHLLQQHVASGPEPRRALSAATIAALRAKLTEAKVELPTWRFRTDPDDQGRAGQWFAPDHDATAAPWRDLRAGSHWENQGEDLKHYTGTAWYRVTVEVPPTFAGKDARLVLEGVDDSYELWLDGKPIAKAGDPAKQHTIWLERQVVELGQSLAPGRHTVALRVVDHAGAGGLWRPAFVTTGPAGTGDPLLH